MSDIQLIQAEPLAKNKTFNTIREYAKFIVAMLGAVGTTTIVAIIEGGFSTLTLMTAIISLLTAFSVYGVKNVNETGTQLVQVDQGETVVVIPVTEELRMVGNVSGEGTIPAILPINSETESN